MKTDSERETIDLCASEIACAVADAWAECPRATSPWLREALDRLESVTRSSPLRKVKR